MVSHTGPAVGIDLVEIKKAKSFYRAHRKKLRKFLRPEELAVIQKSQRPHVALAAILAAKEAIFKTQRRPWMGLSGFKTTRLSNSLVSVTKNKKYVVACALGHSG